MLNKVLERDINLYLLPKTGLKRPVMNNQKNPRMTTSRQPPEASGTIAAPSDAGFRRLVQSDHQSFDADRSVVHAAGL